MNRRNFLKKSAFAAAAAASVPYILPSGRLFAATGARKANHVVFVLFAGGVRNLESMQKADGNLMPYSILGTEPISGDIAPGMTPLPSPSGQPLENFGTLFKEFRYADGPTGHYNAHTTAMTGVYATVNSNISQPPDYPTIFEYYRKHTSPLQNAQNAWWVSDSLGPYPNLNYSLDANYGSIYGANYIRPISLFSQESYDVLNNAKSFNSSEKSKIEKVRSFCDDNFGQPAQASAGVTNAAADSENIEQFILDTMNAAAQGQFVDPWGIGAGSYNADMSNIFAAELILQEFKPELLVVNMQGIDICHSNFTEYCNNIRRADYSLWHLWDTIQNTPGMANDTILIAAPEHGRNLDPNTLVDPYGRLALDHTSTPTSREIFCMVLGPSGTVVQDQQISSVEGESVDIVPTIADILGIYDDIPSNYRSLMGNKLSQAFV